MSSAAIDAARIAAAALCNRHCVKTMTLTPYAVALSRPAYWTIQQVLLSCCQCLGAAPMYLNIGWLLQCVQEQRSPDFA